MKRLDTAKTLMRSWWSYPAPTAYTEAEGSVFLHYSPDDKRVLVDILDFRRFLTDETVFALLAA